MIASNENLSRKDKRGEQMPIEKENFILNLINLETGEELCCIDNLEDNLLSVESKSYSFDKERKALNSFIDLSARTLSIDVSIGAMSLISLMGLDVSNAPDKYNFQIMKVKQARKHKKKRINKKWIKRYRYEQILVDCKGWKLKTHTDGTYEFVK